MSKKTIRRCDICHKTEGVEIKPDDFVDSALSIQMDNFDGSPITVSCNISIKNDIGNDDDIIDDVVSNYTPTGTFDSDVHYTNVYPNNRDIAEAQLEQIQERTFSIGDDNSDLCKVCFKTLLKVVDQYAKFNKMVKF